MVAESQLKQLISLWGLYASMDLLFLARGPQAALAFYLSDLVIGLAAVTATYLLAERFDGIGPQEEEDEVRRHLSSAWPRHSSAFGQK